MSSALHLFRPTLVPGDTVTLVAPSGPVSETELEKAHATLASLGFKVKLGKSALARHAFFAGTDEQRLTDLNEAFNDSTTLGIFCLRGGYGAGRLLPELDFTALKRRPKAVIGYSDITALHSAIYSQANLVSFHGPVAVSTATPSAWKSLMARLAGEDADDILSGYDNPGGAKWLREPDLPVKGTLLGGNLCVLSSLIGSKFAPSFKGAILFIEDIGEQPYRVDRFLNHLRLAGILDQLHGVVCGQFTNCVNDPDDSVVLPSVEEVLIANLQPLKIPVIVNADFGHVAENFTLPHGAPVEILPGHRPRLAEIINRDQL